jgi:hypothetical protein
LVCAQSDGGWEQFDVVEWSRRLPGYTVRPVPCVGWIEPKLVERVISKGATAVLIVGCGSSEAFCKEGNTWLPARLSGAREPAFRPSRADARRVVHVNFDPLRPRLLSAAAARLREQSAVPLAATRTGLAPWLAGLLLTAAVLAGVLLVSDAPFQNPASAEPEFIFTFRASGDWLSSAALALPDSTQDTRPVHMRTAQPAQRGRSPVTVRLVVNDRVEEHVYQAKGFKSDGVAVGELRVPLAAGTHQVAVSLATNADPAAPRATWSAEIQVHPRRLTVLSYDPGQGFQLLP